MINKLFIFISSFCENLNKINFKYIRFNMNLHKINFAKIKMEWMSAFYNELS